MAKKAAPAKSKKGDVKKKAAPAKSKKGDVKKKGKGIDDEFGMPSDAPSTAEGWRFEQEANVGKLFLITPLREQEEKAYGKAGERGERQQIIVADIVEINEKKPEKSVEHTDVWIFAGWVKGALRGYVGERRVPARLERDMSKSQGDKPAWVLEDPSADDIKACRAYIASVDPFAAQKAKKK